VHQQAVGGELAGRAAGAFEDDPFRAAQALLLGEGVDGGFDGLGVEVATVERE
jgi:hypothetical protein